MGMNYLWLKTFLFPLVITSLIGIAVGFVLNDLATNEDGKVFLTKYGWLVFSVFSTELLFFFYKVFKASRREDFCALLTREVIDSKLIKDVTTNYMSRSIYRITNKFDELLSGNASHNMLWELECLDLGEYENMKNLEIDKCDDIVRKIKVRRRKRITEIANELIMKNATYYATETKRPSQISDTDVAFRDRQLELLKKLKPKKVHRFLVLHAWDVVTEFNECKDDLQSFIEFNNFNSDLGIASGLNVLAYTSGLEDFAHIYHGNLNSYYDFAICKRKSLFRRDWVTVFAQNDKAVTFFDSKKPTNKHSAKQFVDFYEVMLSKCEKNDNFRLNKSLFFSKSIKNMEDMLEFADYLYWQDIWAKSN